MRFVVGLALPLLLAGSIALAHIPLTREIIKDALGEIEESRSALESDTSDRAPALYELATRATALMDLLNQEISLHGLEQRDLLEAAIGGAAALGIDIRWSEPHQRFFYTGEAYLHYLQLVHDGLQAANARFHLIETGFYLGDSNDTEELESRAAMARDYLRLYPGTANAERVVIFLAIDTRDLWRICRAADDAACANRYAAQLREHLNTVATRYADGKTGEMARTLLARFEAEAADSG